ncbi:hypothetical protein ACFCX4_32520 [Kitasatospora sp. NPDC056327]|uniref:hypothetical protein n=1 Tax=Kitasatospora sp. NPDC056327 TaxID=3345785 RepID=UPI0035DCB8D3
MTPHRPARPLDVYLNDHLTGAFGGAALARRMAGAHNGAHDDTHDGGHRAAGLRRLAADIEQDRDDLVRIMRRLDVPVHRYRTWLGLAGERIGRLKPNGTLLRRSPLSDLVELEAMRAGVTGKRALWDALLAVADDDPRLDKDHLDRLAGRARAQARTLDAWHGAVSAGVLGRPAPAGSGGRPGSGRTAR